MATNRISRYIPLLFILLILGAVVFLICNNIVWLGDDIYYQYMIPEKIGDMYDNNLRISSIYDIIISQNNHYQSNNGRYVAHFLVQMYCALLGRTAFSISNALIYIFLTILTVLNAKRNVLNIKFICITFSLILLGLSTKMVPTTQIGFIWSIVFVLLFLYLFFECNIKNKPLIAIISIFSCIAGASSESIVIGITIALMIYTLTNWKAITFQQKIMMICFTIGTITLCIAPSNLSRVSTVHIPLYISIFNFIIYSRIFWLLCITILYLRLSHHISLKSIYIQNNNSFYFNSILILLAFNFVISIYCNRQLFGIEILSIVLLIRLIPRKLIRWKTVVIFLIIALVYLIHQFNSIILLNRQMAIIEREYPKSHNGEVYIPIGLESFYFRNFSYTQALPTFMTEDFPSFFIRRKMAELYPNRKPLKLIPDVLYGKDSVNLDNQIFKYNPSTYVVVQSKLNPIEFTISRSIGIGPLSMHYDNLNVNMETCLKETDLWRASIIIDQMPLISIDSIYPSPSK